MRRTTRWAWGLLALAVLAAGCKKVEDEKTVSLDGTEIKMLQVDPQKSDLKLTVTGQSADVPVNACVVTADDEGASETALMNGTAPPKALASAMSQKDFTMEATLPAGKGGTVMLYAGKKADVHVKIVGR